MWPRPASPTTARRTKRRSSPGTYTAAGHAAIHTGLPPAANGIAATRGRGKVVSLSLKDRAAVISGGQKADAAIWYDSALPGFTTSRYYAGEFPEWLSTWRDAHPLKERLAPWRPLDSRLLAVVVGADDAPGEGDWLGLGKTFPHDPALATDRIVLCARRRR